MLLQSQAARVGMPRLPRFHFLGGLAFELSANSFEVVYSI